MAHHMLSPPPKTQTPPLINHPPPRPSSSDTSFPILAISILGILTTAILLVSYYVFVIKCCLNWRRSDVISRLSNSRSRRRRRRGEEPLTVYAATAEGRGLEESAIRSIPIFRFKKSSRDGYGDETTGFFHECAVCLNEFEDDERLRRLPSCSHAFHIDCIDTWLQTNANCPLCRSDITGVTAQIPHQDPHVVIEVRDDGGGGGDGDHLTTRSETSVQPTPTPTPTPQNPSPRKTEQQRFVQKKVRKLHHVSSMGDECIDVRGKDEQFSIKPMRRSFSMDSSCDRQLYLSVQEILQQNPHFYSQEIVSSSGEGSSNGGGGSAAAAARFRRSFFSFGRSSRNAVLPTSVEP